MEPLTTAPELTCGTSPHFHNKENHAPHTSFCRRHTDAEQHAADLQAQAEAEARGEDSEHVTAPKVADVYDRCWAFSRFPTTSLSEQAFADRILSGLAWIPATFGGQGRRKNNNWQQSELIALDFDSNVKVDDCLNIPLIWDYALVVHPSASSGKPDADGQPVYKTRVIFRLDQPITDLEQYRTSVIALGRLIGLPEDACSYKPAQLFYGSTNRIEQPYSNLGVKLPRSIVDAETANIRAEAGARRAEELQRRAEQHYQPVAKDSSAAADSIERILRHSYDKVLSATSDRTTMAYKQASWLARFLAYWPITQQDIERTLLDALRANGAEAKYSTNECLRHIGNGIETGQSAPPEPLELPADTRYTSASNGVRRTGTRGDDRAEDGENSPAADLKTALYFPDGVPDSWRSALLNLDGNDSTALVYELLTEGLRRDIILTEGITAKSLLDCNDALQWGLPVSLIRKSITALAGMFFSDLHTENPNTVCKSGNNPPGGRPMHIYSLRPLSEARARLLGALKPVIRARRYPTEAQGEQPAVAADLTPRALESIGVDKDEATSLASALNDVSQPIYAAQRKERAQARRREENDLREWSAALENTTSSPLPEGWSKSSLRLYRLAYLRARKVAANMGTSRRAVAEALGVGKRIVGDYLELAGIDVEPVPLQEAPIRQGIDLDKQLRTIQGEMQGRVMSVVSRGAGGYEREISYTGAEAREFMVSELRAGNQIFVGVQVANKHIVIVDAAPPQPREAQDKHTYLEFLNSPTREKEHVPAPEVQRPLFSYAPEWVRGQLVLRLDLLGWRQVDRFVSPDGEFVETNAHALDLLALLTGSKAHPVDELLDFAISLGGVLVQREFA